MSQPQFPNFKPYDRVAVRMPMQRYVGYSSVNPGPKAGDLLYVIKQDLLETRVEEARTGIHMTIQTLDLEHWTR